MLGKKKKDVSEEIKEEVVETSDSEQVQFQKNIKLLWIYTTLFVLFALTLIVISSVIQSKIHSEAEYYQDRYNKAQSSNQSTIKNIEDENNILKAEIENIKKENEQLAAQADEDAKIINDAAQLAENAEYLVLAQQSYIDDDEEMLKTNLDKVDPTLLHGSMKDVYDTLKKLVE